MWCLVSSTGQVSYNITPGKVHTVSRKVGDIILANDQSVSRKHAFLEVKYPVTDGIYVWDDNSKYGSFVNDGIKSNVKLEKEKKYTLREGDTVRFGLQDNIWTLKREVPLVYGHMLKPPELKKIISAVSKSGGKYAGKWTKDITHLCTNTLHLTHEIMCTLASAKPIVTPLFWEHYTLMLAGKGALADPAKFIPTIHDSELSGRENLCLPNAARKSLFKDKLFIIPYSKNFEILKTIIELAGGKAIKLSDCKLPREDYCKPNVVLLKCPDSSEETALYKQVLNKLSESRRHAVPEEDIGLALWKVSTEKYCNPAFSSSQILRNPLETPSQPDTGATLVQDTEDVRGASTGQTETDQSLVIPPSCSDNMYSTDDTTQSLSVRPVAQRKVETSEPAPGPSCKRSRYSEENSENVSGQRSKSVKSEPKSQEDEDLFADDATEPSLSNISVGATIVPEPSMSNVSICVTNTPRSKVEKIQAHSRDDDDDDDFFLPSPPKRKKPKKSEVTDDMFDLPEPPPTQVSKNNIEDDDFDLPSPRKLSLNSKRANKSANSSALNQSDDMFQSLESTCGASTSHSAKRKGRNDSESEVPPPKRPTNGCVDITNVHGSTVAPHIKTNNFISKTDIKRIKKEESDQEQNDEDEICIRLQAKVVLVPLLIRPRESPKLDNSKSTNSSVKNFKKFRKNWGGNNSADRHQVTTNRVLITTTANRSSFSTNANSDEDEDDPFSPERPVQRRTNGNTRNNVHHSEDEDDEFALPSFSQV